MKRIDAYNLRLTGITELPLPHNPKLLSVCFQAPEVGTDITVANSLTLWAEVDMRSTVVAYKFAVVQAGEILKEMPGHYRKFVGSAHIPEISAAHFVFVYLPEDAVG